MIATPEASSTAFSMLFVAYITEQSANLSRPQLSGRGICCGRYSPSPRRHGTARAYRSEGTHSEP